MSEEQQATQPSPPPEAPEPLEDEMLLEEEAPAHNDSFMRFLANFLPWVISLLFHLGILLVMMFVVMVGVQTIAEDEIIVPNAELSDDPGVMNPSRSNISDKKSTTVKKTAFKMNKADPGKSKAKLTEVIGATGGAASAGNMGIKAVGGQRSSFFGTGGGNVYNVVYVVDRSGSMVDTFDHVRNEMIRSIGKLSPKQTFHVIFFAEGKPEQLKTRRLISATPANKLKAVEFLKEVVAEGQTDVVPALKEAFRVLDGARKRGRLVYLLTDGDFRGKEPEVLKFLREKNQDKKVHVNTFLYSNIGMKRAEDTLKTIASENGGKYRPVPYEE